MPVWKQPGSTVPSEAATTGHPENGRSAWNRRMDAKSPPSLKLVRLMSLSRPRQKHRGNVIGRGPSHPGYDENNDADLLPGHASGRLLFPVGE